MIYETKQTVYKIVKPSDIYYTTKAKEIIQGLLKTWKIVDFRPVNVGEQYISGYLADGVVTAEKPRYDGFTPHDDCARFIVILRDQPIDFPEWE